MPKGVICGGAVDGSNHDGAMVTCQAIVASPCGVWPAAPWAIPSTATTITSAWGSQRAGIGVLLRDLRAAIDARHAGVDAREHLVGNGAGPRGQLLDGDRRGAGLAQQHRLVAIVGGVPADG